MTNLNSFPVRRLYLWTGAFVIIGVSVGLDAALDLWAGESGVLLWIVVFSGFLMVSGAAHEAQAGDPDDFTISGYWLVFLLLAALLSFSGFVLQFAGLAG